jgi:hypothetical protein
MAHRHRIDRAIHVARCLCITRVMRQKLLRVCFDRIRYAAATTRRAAETQTKVFVLRRWRQALERRRTSHEAQKEAWVVAQAPVVNRLLWVFPLRACLRRWAQKTAERADARRRQALRSRLLAAAQGALQ